MMNSLLFLNLFNKYGTSPASRLESTREPSALSGNRTSGGPAGGRGHESFAPKPVCAPGIQTQKTSGSRSCRKHPS